MLYRAMYSSMTSELSSAVSLADPSPNNDCTSRLEFKNKKILQTLAAVFTCPCSAMGKTRKDLGPGRRAGEGGEHVRAC